MIVDQMYSCGEGTYALSIRDRENDFNTRSCQWVMPRCDAEFCRVWPYVAVCGSVLPCVAMCCRVLPCIAVCCRVLPCVAVCCRVLLCVAVCCNVLPCVVVCCSVLHSVLHSVLPCVAVCCSVTHVDAAYLNMAILVRHEIDPKRILIS